MCSEATSFHRFQPQAPWGLWTCAPAHAPALQRCLCRIAPGCASHRARRHGRTNVLYPIEYPGSRTGSAAPPALSGSSSVPRWLEPACDYNPRYRVLRIRKIGVHLWVRGPVVRQAMPLFREIMLPTPWQRGFGAVAQHLNGRVLPGHPRGSPRYLET